MRVLLVEDDDSLRKSAVRMLRHEGFDIVEAANADEACTRCARYAPHVLFTDIQLPGTLDGWDVAERCRSRDPHIAVVYTTAFPSRAPRPVPGSLMLEKPYSHDQLVDALRGLGQAHAVATSVRSSPE
jgi:CheY-like chemotaxis protein